MAFFSDEFTCMSSIQLKWYYIYSDMNILVSKKKKTLENMKQQFDGPSSGAEY